MDVDTDNFEEALAEIERHLPQSAFVAVDLEMTGIFGPPATKVNNGDVPQVQYTKGRAVVGRPYNIVQMGVTLFHEKSPGQYDVRPFNIYVFPRTFDERDREGKPVKVSDHFMGMSASSMEFLAKNGLDFNRWIHKGVSYVGAAGEEMLQRAMPAENATNQGSFSSRGGDKPEATRPQDLAFISDVMKQVATFASSEDKEMKLQGTNGFLALILRQKIGEQHPSLTVEKRKSPVNPNWEDRWVVKLDAEGKKDREATVRRRILSHIGVRRLWNVLKAHHRPIVLHNGFFDLLFLSTALEGNLPFALADFKRQLHVSFPFLVDTKVLAEAPALSGLLGTRSTLEQMAAGLDRILAEGRASAPEGGADVSSTGEAATMGEAAAATTAEGGSANKVSVSFEFPPGFEKYSSKEGCFHEAGYDAYQTGRIFAYFRAKLGEERTIGFVNRIFLMFSAFQLCVSEEVDQLLYNGIARYLYDVDTNAINNRGLFELLKPVCEDGKRKVAIKWCGDTKSLLLIAYGELDKPWDATERQTVGQIMDGLLRPQEEQKRLKFSTMESHLESIATAALTKGEREGAGSGGAPDAKRQRVG